MNQEQLFWVVLGVLSIALLRVIFKRKRPWHSLLVATLSGVLALFPVSFLLQQGGYELTVNAHTLGISVVLGIPGVLGMAGFCVFL